MNREPLITVVTASYNNLDGLMRSIYSVCMQTYRKIEYIICDDCSEKYSEEAIETFLQKHRKSNIIRYKIIHNTKNVGTVKNLNSIQNNIEITSRNLKTQGDKLHNISNKSNTNEENTKTATNFVDSISCNQKCRKFLLMIINILLFITIILVFAYKLL